MRTPLALALCVLTLPALRAPALHAQARPTATQPLQLSAFAGVTGNFTGLSAGRNLGITAGADLSFPAFHSIRPALEVRGLYPVDKGHVDNQRNILAGLRLSRQFGLVHPYVDILVGRGQVDYTPALPNSTFTFFYQQSASNVLSPRAGVEVPFSGSLSFKADAQFQRYTTPVTVSGVLYSVPLTAALVYRLHFSRRPR